MQSAPIFTARRNDIVVEEVIDEVLIYDRRSDVAHCLSEIAALVWRTCEGGATLGEIAERIIVRDLAGSNDAAMELADTAVSELVEKGLLETSGVEASAAVSRRQALRRMAGVGGAAVMAPLIVSAAIHPAAAFASPPCTAGGAQGCPNTACCTGYTTCTSTHGGSGYCCTSSYGAVCSGTNASTECCSSAGLQCSTSGSPSGTCCYASDMEPGAPCTISNKSKCCSGSCGTGIHINQCS
jgi:hypothetical protein